MHPRPESDIQNQNQRHKQIGSGGTVFGFLIETIVIDDLTGFLDKGSGQAGNLSRNRIESQATRGPKELSITEEANQS